MEQQPPRTTILAFGGMAAGPLFVAPQKRALGQSMIVPVWPMHRRGESVADYARRWAAELAPAIPRDRPLVLLGVSFGGMIALEMADTLRADAVVLIASGRSSACVAPLYKALERSVAWIPWGLSRPIAPLIGWAHAVQMRLRPAHRRLLVRVAREMDLAKTQWCAYGVTHWPGLSAEREAKLPPVMHIHGDDDPLMPVEKVTPTVMITGARHLLHLSHEAQVNELIRDFIDRVTRR